MYMYMCIYTYIRTYVHVYSDIIDVFNMSLLMYLKFYLVRPNVRTVESQLSEFQS